MWTEPTEPTMGTGAISTTEVVVTIINRKIVVIVIIIVVVILIVITVVIITIIVAVTIEGIIKEIFRVQTLATRTQGELAARYRYLQHIRGTPRVGATATGGGLVPYFSDKVIKLSR